VVCVKEFAQNNPEVNKLAVEKYQKQNKDKVRKVQSRWRKNNPDKYRLQKRRYRNAEGFFTKKDIEDLREKQGNCCGLCGIAFSKEIKYEVDHIIPVSRGGSNWPQNLQLLCRSCNAKKSNIISDKFKNSS
jgi:5-methylcytosine-specific restriction endonuclease McrA